MALIKELLSLSENTQEIWEIQLTYAAGVNDERRATREITTFEAQDYAYRYECFAELDVWIGPSGGWPEYIFWGPRVKLLELLKDYTQNDVDLLAEYLPVLTPSKRAWHKPEKPVKPKSLAKMDKDFLRDLEPDDTDQEIKTKEFPGSTNGI